MYAVVNEKTKEPATSSNEPIIYDSQERAFREAEQWNMATAHIGGWWDVHKLTREEVKTLHRTGYKRFR